MQEQSEALTNRRTDRASARVSIILPTLNEAENINSRLEELLQFPDAELVFCDGGSSDGTAEMLLDYAKAHTKIQFVRSPSGRGRQMNAGAARATSEWLIFLHADTSLPQSTFQLFRDLIASDETLQSGAFCFRVDHERRIYRVLEHYVSLRCRLLKLPFGDQAIFVRTSLFRQLGGYRDDFPLMEDVDLVQRLKKQPGFRILAAPVFTSARRYERDGYFNRASGNFYLQLRYFLGTHPKKLAERYRKKELRQGGE